MRTGNLFASSALAVCASLALAAPAAAQDEDESDASDLTISGSVDLVSDYRFRGVSFSDEDPAIQGSINLEHSSGFYIGTWASSLEDSGLYGSIEVDLYAGYATEIAPGTGLDIGLLYYAYPNGDSAFGDAEYFEPYVSLTQALGPVDATIGAAYAPSQDALGNADNIYLHGGLDAPLPGTPISLSAHAGYSDGSLAYVGSYWDWSLGASADIGPLTVGIAYIDTDLPDVPGQDTAVVFSISAGF
ncbi:TorF family putative porin [Pseudoblastomonas halimionae]|uniref:Porin n=1 Tax=Alteriqipengyuania halimionae TaxID=1926630 RepID=A0A6I4U6R2_9SPHN|nr:TorF family putative porin [Alteriqipengyuania halimionae]MXP10543.1 hypothetical protein [Alteriqipengyuania halimionae]